MSNKISVIIPVYKVAKFVQRCAKSLMEQTLKEEVEFIFVDDYSPDNSVEIIKSTVENYPMRKSQVKIISHNKNRGLPAARNTGLANSQGDYIFHCDGDDYVEPDFLELMLTKAIEEKADAVWCDWYLSFDKKERIMRQPQATSARNALSDILNGSMKYNVWNKIVKRTIYNDNNIFFPEGHSMGEDMTMIRLISKIKKVAYINKPLYHYIRTNSEALTYLYSSKSLSDVLYNTSQTEKYVLDNIQDENIIKEFSWFKLGVKFPLLFTGNRKDITLWRSLFKECHPYILSNKAQSLRARCLQICAASGLTYFNLIYYRLIHKFIYGFIYK